MVEASLKTKLLVSIRMEEIFDTVPLPLYATEPGYMGLRDKDKCWTRIPNDALQHALRHEGAVKRDICRPEAEDCKDCDQEGGRALDHETHATSARHPEFLQTPCEVYRACMEGPVRELAAENVLDKEGAGSGGRVGIQEVANRLRYGDGVEAVGDRKVLWIVLDLAG